ncbi:MAG: hypothetical protein LBN27_03115 [Prevotellaceae bacterium]|jgi:hypothetical protein|nr:hypothetical protein [Prevotellaceae bacterium]
MIIEISKPITAVTFRQSINSLKEKRRMQRRESFEEFFGALPNIGDGLEYQKSLRNEWK